MNGPTSLSLILLLGASPAEEPPVWPLALPDGARLERLDLDGDGHMDLRARGQEGGSGWSTFTTCVQRGPTGHVACEQTQTTAYALFSASQRTLQPPDDNHANALLGPDDCAAPNPDDPAQGAMWALRAPLALPGRVTPAGPWMPGRPRDQQSVCLTVTQASQLVGGLSWDPGHDPDEPLVEAGWRVRYNAAWPQLVSPGAPHNRAPIRRGTVGALEIYQHGHALAVYDPARDRHAWILNLAAAQGEGFKFDRWESIEAVKSVGDERLEVVVNSYLWAGMGEDVAPLVVDLAPMLAR